MILIFEYRLNCCCCCAAAGVVPGERTGVLPYWKVLLLPILILFLMSYFFEAPPETFHTVIIDFLCVIIIELSIVIVQKLQDVIQHLNETQDGLVKAHHRAIHMQKNYDNLLNDYMSMQKEVEDLRVHCSMPCEDPVRKEEVDALFEEFKEQERALLEEIRGDFEALRRGKESESDADSNSTLMQKVSELEGQIDELQDETVLMVRSFESLEESFDSVKQEYLKAEEQVQKDLEEMENELMEELETYIKELPPPEMDELLREQAISIIKEVSRKELEEIFASRVEELKLSFASQGVDVDGEVSESDEDLVEVDQDSLEKLIVDALSQELAEVRSELHGAIANAVDDCNQSVHDTSKSGGTSQRDFALRRAGGQVMYSRTSSTYTPNEAEQNRLHQYESQDFTGTATKSLRSSLSGMLTGALDQVESLLGNDVYFARRTLFETGVGGPDEAISEDLSLGSCWAMKVSISSWYLLIIRILLNYYIMVNDVQGKQGFLTVRLKDPLLVTSLTIDHVSPHEALDISTAPAKFKVYGYSDDDSASYTEKKPK